MLDLVGIITLAAIIALNISAFSQALPLPGGARLAVSAGAGAWTGLAAAAAASGLLANTGLPFPVMGIFVFLPLLAAGAAAFLVPAFRSAVLGVPLTTLIGLNIARVLGGFFLLLAAQDRLGGPFPLSAGCGDVITGVLAISVLRSATQATEGGDRAILMWNAFGALDLFVAVGLGVISANGSPLQLIHAGAGSAAVQALPWSLIPSVLVPFYLITHGLVLAKLWARRAHMAAPAQAASRAM